MIAVSQSKQGLLNAIISAAVVFYCQVALHQLYLLPFVAFVPLIYALLNAENKVQLFLISLTFSLLLSALDFWGCESYGYAVYFGAITTLCTSYMTGFLSLAVVLRGHLTQLRALSAAAVFVIIDLLLSKIPYFATARVAGMLSFDPVFIQLASITGHLAVSFFVVYTNIIFATVLFQKNYLSIKVVPAFIVILSLFAYGKITLPQYPEVGNEKVSIIQGSVLREEYEMMSESHEIQRRVFDRYFELSREAVAQGASVIVWPETAIRSFFGVRSEITNFVRTHQVEIFGGFPFINGPVDKQSNSVLWIDKKGEIRDRYDKLFLIPISEDEFSRGEENKPLNTPIGRISTPICFEALFPDLVRESVFAGGEAIFIFSNDAGFDWSTVSALMLRQAIVRAVENNRWLIRVGQNGISAEVTPHGIVNDLTKLFEQRVFHASFSKISETSFYTRYGDWFVIILLLIIGVERLYSKKKK